MMKGKETWKFRGHHTSYFVDKQKARSNLQYLHSADMLSQQPFPSDKNVVLNYLCGSKIGNITKGTEAITTSYDGSLIS